MKTLVRLTGLIGVFVILSGAPAYARGGGGGHGGGGGFGGGGHVGGGHAFGGGHFVGSAHQGFGGHPGFDGHHFEGHRFDHDRFHGRAFVGVGPSFYWDPYWDPYWPYGPYTYAPAPLSVGASPLYVEKPQAGYCGGVAAYYPNVQSCPQPWVRVAPHAG